uniref:Uncharacterized protein n=1 Tax=Arundo donax TaxID=35708 RepID=A0A0A9BDA0_ARUDO
MAFIKYLRPKVMTTLGAIRSTTTLIDDQL